MKRRIIVILLMVSAFGSFAQNKYYYTEASDLNLGGKLFRDTPIPYHRVDTARFEGFTDTENKMLRESSGIYCLFKTDSKSIRIKVEYGHVSYRNNTNGFSSRGFDMYIRKNGEWLWAASACPRDIIDLKADVALISDMDGTEHECLLYLPLYSEVYSVKIGVEEGTSIAPIDNTFKYRIALFGSSLTHGSSTTRCGMAYPSQFSRMTDLQILSIGCSGRSKLQGYFADVLCAAQDVDALIIDGFSNPSAATIRQRLFPFIEKLVAAHPGKPIIFQETIYRNLRHFNTKTEAKEALKAHVSDSLMKIACKKYPDVYYVRRNIKEDITESSVDGTHPDNYGYTVYARAMKGPIVKILSKYGIKGK